MLRFLRLALPSARVAKADARSLLARPFDFPSVAEAEAFHREALERGRDVKGMFTTDPTTIAAVDSVIDSSSHADFLRDKIFRQPILETTKFQSSVVLVSDVRDFAYPTGIYEKHQKEDVLLCIGGPAAEHQVVLAGMIEKVREKLHDIIYINKEYRESNANHSAMQSHARHGNALNADERLTGHSLLPVLLMRALIGVDDEEAVEANFTKIDVKFTIDPRKLRIYFGNEMNWLMQEMRRREGVLTEHDINRMESLLSQEIIKVVEEESGVRITAGDVATEDRSSSMHIAFTEAERLEIEKENAEYSRVGILAKTLDRDEIDFLFDSRAVHSAWRYSGDTSIRFDIHEINRKLAEGKRVRWIDGTKVKRICLCQDEDGRARAAGVVDEDNNFIYASKIHTSFGYMTRYAFDPSSKVRFLRASWMRNVVNRLEDFLDLQPPIAEALTISTGVSVNAVFRNSERMKKLIMRFGTSGEVAVINSHWTTIAHNDDFIMMRITGGGNTGSEEYNPAYFLNVIANSRRIFGDDLVGVLSTYGCPRSINAKNSTQFSKLAEGFIASYGKGGTGVTKGHAEAVFGLVMLGFEEEVVEFFNQFQHSRSGGKLGDEVMAIYDHFKANFYEDETKKTNRRMGYDSSFSDEEKFATAAIFAAVMIYYANKKLKKDDSKKVEIIH